METKLPRWKRSAAWLQEESRASGGMPPFLYSSTKRLICLTPASSLKVYLL